ncbi:MAG: metallophosphoesterase family protein [Candidatus Loosdrechtia sp.]|uniref:metallophosphoesterase family protein n=1 Tax=Candidatus Loosdrechtia sp. TaxID=3101272 RepID=UPI003A6D2A0B|nr:MAG: YfcE family phosphodiesterase [Candidatus Jettenia sp. AMX2]
MKVLVISDVHGNLSALDAIREKADMVFCLGDLVNYGPYPAACIDRIKGLTDKIIRGNHDNAIGRNMDCGCSVKYKELSDAGKIFTRSVLNDADKSFLGNLPIILEGEVGGIRFLLSHGSPSGDIYQYLKPDVPDEVLEERIQGINADMIFIGHTHFPMIRRIRNITVVNPGSVGQPRDGIPEASYAIWEDGHVEIKRVPYNIESTIQGLRETSIPSQQVEILATILRKGGMF